MIHNDYNAIVLISRFMHDSPRILISRRDHDTASDCPAISLALERVQVQVGSSKLHLSIIAPSRRIFNKRLLNAFDA